MSKWQYFMNAFSFYGLVGFCREMDWFFAIVFNYFGYSSYF